MKLLIIILLFTCAGMNMSAQVNFITTIAGNGTPAYCCDGGPATNAEINSSDGICLDKFGNLYLVDGGNNRVRKIVLSTGIITTVAGIDTFGYNGDGIQATNAELFIPDAIYTDSSGNIYIADPGNSRVRKITIVTGVISTIAGNGTPGNSGDGGPATNAEINAPDGLYIDESGNIYIADLNNSNIRKVAPNGIITTIAGNGGMGYTGDGGPATSATFFAPTKAIVDNYGNVIVADADNNALRKIDATTNIITTMAGNGIAGYSGDGGLAVNAKLNSPYGVYIDKQNDIFFTDYGNGAIRKIDGNTGIISTIVGCGLMGYGGDGGPATDAKLKPEDLTFDTYGTMYIADYENNRIRMVYNPKLSISNTQMNLASVQIYPNPAQDELTIEGAKGSDLKIFNLVGQMMLSSKINSNKEAINIQMLTAGIYIVQVVDALGNVTNKRLVVAQ